MYITDDTICESICPKKGVTVSSFVDDLCLILFFSFIVNFQIDINITISMM